MVVHRSFVSGRGRPFQNLYQRNDPAGNARDRVFGYSRVYQYVERLHESDSVFGIFSYNEHGLVYLSTGNDAARGKYPDFIRGRRNERDPCADVVYRFSKQHNVADARRRTERLGGKNEKYYFGCRIGRYIRFRRGVREKNADPPGEYALKPVTSMPVFEDDGSYEYYIGGWNGPAQADEKAMRILSECGINHIMLPNTTIAPSLMKTIIKNAAKYGVKAYPQMMGKITATPEEFFNHVFDDSLGEKGLAGFCYYDEPMTDKFDGFVRLVENHNEKYKDLDFFINLYGEIYYNDLPQNTAESYMEYVMMYCSKVLSKVEGRRILSVDHYPLQWSKSTQDNFRISPTWLPNLRSDCA